MELPPRNTSVFEGLDSDQLRVKAGNCVLEAKKAEDPLERLAFLQYAAEALQLGHLTVESLGIDLRDIIRIANGSYRGPAPEATAIHHIVSQIILSFPRL